MTTQEDTEIKAVYPEDAGPPEPLATRFCNALLDVPVQRTAECCKATPGFSSAPLCMQPLSFALRSGAVELSASDIERCAEAVAQRTKGCDWVGGSAVLTPPACDGIIRGKLAADKPCRSSLECAPGLHCHGLSATRIGVCGRPAPEGSLCGGTIDPLAALTIQLAAETAHPECAGGYCLNGHCAAFTKTGGECRANAQCGPNLSCRDGHCSTLPLPGPGQPCLYGECAEGNHCVRGTCIVPRDYDAECELDQECRGACLVPEGGTKGRCGTRCPTFSIPETPQTAPSAKRDSGPKRR